MIFLRSLQKRDTVVLEVLLDSGGMSELDLTVYDGTGRKYGTSATVPSPAGFSNTAFYTGAVTDGNTVSPDFTFDKVAGSNPTIGVWLRLVEITQDTTGTFTPTLSITKIEDASGADVSGTAVITASTHISPSTAQLAEANLLDDLLPSLGLSSGDSLGKRHFQPYDPSSPIGSQGIADAPVVNAFLNYDEVNALIRVGLLTRGSGPVVDKIIMPEAGKRVAGFPL